MATISLCMIVKNEEAVLARCLDSIADLMDEIIIVDTGSTDNTKEIAAKYTSQTGLSHVPARRVNANTRMLTPGNSPYQVHFQVTT